MVKLTQNIPKPDPPTLRAVLPDGRIWPCALRHSARATRCRLRVNAEGVVTLVIPAQSPRSPAALQEVLNSLTPWLAKTLTRLLGASATPPSSCAPPAPPELPASINIPLSGMVWHVYVQHKPGRIGLHEDAGGRILLYGPTDAPAFHETCCMLLQRWLRSQGSRHLPPRLQVLAARMHVQVSRVTVRAQRGRWGSCSSRGHISLNCLLLLLPLPLLDHVCLHELCHLQHMDHSRRYRAHLAQHAPQWQWQEKALDTAWRRMPIWATWRASK